MKILITGVAGLFGVNFSKYLLDKGYDVFGIDNMFGGYKEFIDDRLLQNKVADIDLVDIDKVNNIFEEFKPDYVYHFAAYAAEGLSPFIRNFNYTNNILCSANMINAAINHDIKKFIFTSSLGVYGDNKLPYTESQTPNPKDPYAIAKFAIEMDLKQAKEQFDLDYSIIRPHNVFGIYQNVWDKYRNVIGIWIRQAINEEEILIYGDGEQVRAFSDVKYYMKPFEDLMMVGNGEIINLGADKEYKLIEIADMVQRIAVKKGLKRPEFKFLEKRYEEKESYCSHRKAKHLLDFNDETDMEESIEELFDWVLTQPNREVKMMKYEIEKNLYSYWKKIT